MTKYMELEPIKSEVQDGICTRRCKITRFDGEVQTDVSTLWFQFDDSVQPPADNDCDSYVLTTVMLAMKEGRDIRVKGSVSKQLLSNLVEYQSIWAKWLPESYFFVDIAVDELRQEYDPVPGAVCAFSGGVDATFSVWRHSQNKWGHRSQTINKCALVHGFDIPLANKDDFKSAGESAAKTLNDVGLDLVRIRTNIRNILRSINWEFCFGNAV
ncbi:MAG: hypothetical protein AAF889_14910, partial [Cyanobacteria bacterium P01_D01_bin.73]